MAAPKVAEPVTTIAELEKKVADLSEREARHFKILENLLSKFGTHYNSEGRPSLFIVDDLVNAGANGVSLSPHQGLFETFGLPMKLVPPKRGERNTDGPCWIPLHVPERTEELIELFDSESANGDNPKTNS